jgi:hypothetical protein
MMDLNLNTPLNEPRQELADSNCVHGAACLDGGNGVCDPLFRDRVPEAAAHQLATVLAWLVECQLATLEQLMERKSSSRKDVERQALICTEAVRHCAELGVSPSGLAGKACERLRERLAAFPWLPKASVLDRSDATLRDEVAVDEFAGAMKQGLRRKRFQGRAGWDDPQNCTEDLLADMLVRQVPKGDLVYIANLSMLLHRRGAAPSVLARASSRAPNPSTCNCCPGGLDDDTAAA